MADLLDCLRWPGSDDRDPRKMLGMGDLGDGQALDVIAAPGKQPDDAGENARLVIDQNRKRVDLDIRLAEGRGIGREGGRWSVHGVTRASCRRHRSRIRSARRRRVEASRYAPSPMESSA